MSDQVALALFTAIPPTIAIMIAAWRGEVRANRAAIDSSDIHEAVNGSWKANQKVIRGLEAKVSQLESIIAKHASSAEERLEEIRGSKPE